VQVRLASIVLLLIFSTAVARAQSPVETQVYINTAVQDALAWTGHYDELADGALGQKSISAIAEFQRTQGWAPTGDLDSAQKVRLFQIAEASRRQVGFDVINDPRAAMAIALPTRLLATRTETPRGSRYASADGQVEIYLARFGPTEKTLSSLYSTVVNSTSMTGITFKLLRRDVFFVAGFDQRRDFYHSARVFGNEVRGFTIAYPRERAAVFGPIVIAMANSFKSPIIDYAAIAKVIAPESRPAVAGYEQRGDTENFLNTSCDELWLLRNTIFKAAGYCFQTERAIRQLGNEGCRFADADEVPLSEKQRERLAAIRKSELEKSCGQTVTSPRSVQFLRVLDHVSEGILNLRAGPGTSFSVIITIPAGATGIRRSEPCMIPPGSSGWCKIECSGMQGWASMSGLAYDLFPPQSSAAMSKPETQQSPGSGQDTRRNITQQIRAPMPTNIGNRAMSPKELFEGVGDSIWLVVSADSTASLRENAAQGSAVAISSSELVTNCHVVKQRPLIGLVQGKKVLFAKLASARSGDRCVIETEPSLTPVRAVRPFGDLKVGERVYTVGNPRGLERTLGEGLISGLRSTSQGNWVQTTAPVSPGSSGGGLFDESGNLIGITTFVVKESQALNFAIAADEFWR
jgi:Trypsin-like peptidase domain/YARHG domain/Putative peptidoglycan binding domain